MTLTYALMLSSQNSGGSKLVQLHNATESKYQYAGGVCYLSKCCTICIDAWDSQSSHQQHMWQLQRMLCTEINRTKFLLSFRADKCNSCFEALHMLKRDYLIQLWNVEKPQAMTTVERTVLNQNLWKTSRVHTVKAYWAIEIHENLGTDIGNVSYICDSKKLVSTEVAICFCNHDTQTGDTLIWATIRFS